MSKGKSWGSLTKQPGTEYQQVSSGESHGGKTGGKFVPGCKGPEYQTNTTGDAHPAVSNGKFIGPTKGNSDNDPNRTKNTPHGSYKGS